MKRYTSFHLFRPPRINNCRKKTVGNKMEEIAWIGSRDLDEGLPQAVLGSLQPLPTNDLIRHHVTVLRCPTARAQMFGGAFWDWCWMSRKKVTSHWSCECQTAPETWRYSCPHAAGGILLEPETGSKSFSSPSLVFLSPSPTGKT